MNWHEVVLSIKQDVDRRAQEISDEMRRPGYSGSTTAVVIKLTANEVLICLMRALNEGLK